MHQLHREQLQNNNDDLNTSGNSSIMVCSKTGIDVMDGLEMIPDYHSTELTQVCFIIVESVSNCDFLVDVLSNEIDKLNIT